MAAYAMRRNLLLLASLAFGALAFPLLANFARPDRGIPAGERPVPIVEGWSVR